LLPSRRRKRPRYVVDTSTLCRGIRAFFSRDKQAPASEISAPTALFIAWQRDLPAFDWVYSEDILDEYKNVLNELRLRDLYIGQLIAAIRKAGTLVTPMSFPDVSPDPADNIFYAAAEAANGAQIVTNNLKHFPQTDTVQVLSPEQALAQLQREP
jgi:predicted nucleic acid-binding protein